MNLFKFSDLFSVEMIFFLFGKDIPHFLHILQYQSNSQEMAAYLSTFVVTKIGLVFPVPAHLSALLF